ncbi:MAG TPA: cyclase family protein [Anoxybacillus sp.]|jgi:kynurenine formamidase|nr:cyclase family protein [Anoxybacillus sp.]
MKIKKIVDLSMPITPQTPIYPGDPKPDIEPITTFHQEGYHVSRLTLGSHTGTHVDAPFHFRQDGERIDEVPLSKFIGKGVVINVTDKEECQAITVDDVKPYLNKLTPGVIALFHTGWSKYVSEDKYFRHPYISIEVVQAMIDRGIRTFFIDALNIDPPDGSAFPAHEAITSVNGVIGENFINFEKIDFADPYIIAFPLCLPGVDGSPVRAVAVEFV